MRNNKHSLIIVLIIIIGVSLLNPLGFQIYVHAQGTAPALRVSVTIENVVDLACENLQVFVTNAGETNTFPISSSCSTGIISLLPGLYSAELNGLGTADVISDTGCSGNVDSNSGIRECTFRVGFIQGQGQSELAEDVLGSAPGGLSSGQVQDEQVEAVSQSEGIVLTDPAKQGALPFEECVSAGKTATTEDTSTILRAPSSAQYTVQGKASLSELARILNDKNTNDFTLKINHDLRANDGITLAYANPIFTGIMAVGLYPYEVEEVNFNIDRIDTKCNYITLIEPIDPHNKKLDITPLGDVGQNKFEGKPVPPPIPERNELLTGGSIVGRQDTDARIFNPFFNPCDKSMKDKTDKTNLAQYILTGNIDRSKLATFDNNQAISLVMTSDTVLENSDAAKIVNNLNPYVSARFVVDPGNEKGVTKVLDFNIEEISTTCTGVGFDLFPQEN